MGIGQFLHGGFPIPFNRLSRGFVRSYAIFKALSQRELCLSIVKFGGLAITLDGFYLVSANPQTISMASAQVVKCLGILIFSGLAETFDCFGIVLVYTLSKKKA